MKRVERESNHPRRCRARNLRFVHSLAINSRRPIISAIRVTCPRRRRQCAISRSSEGCCLWRSFFITYISTSSRQRYCGRGFQRYISFQYQLNISGWIYLREFTKESCYASVSHWYLLSNFRLRRGRWIPGINNGDVKGILVEPYREIYSAWVPDT